MADNLTLVNSIYKLESNNNNNNNNLNNLNYYDLQTGNIVEDNILEKANGIGIEYFGNIDYDQATIEHFGFDIMKEVTKNFNKIGDTIKKEIGGQIEKIINEIKKEFNKIIDTVKKEFNGIIDKVKDIIEKVKEGIKVMVDKITEIFKVILKELEGIVDDLEYFASAIVNGVKNIMFYIVIAIASVIGLRILTFVF
jgi:phage-related protein